MYYSCKKCNEPLTEFDICFGKHLLSDYRAHNANCFYCQTGGGKQVEKYKRYKNLAKIYTSLFITIIISLVVMFVGAIFGSGALAETMKENEVPNHIISTLIVVGSILTCVAIIYCLVYFIRCDYLIVSQMYKVYSEGGDYKGFHYESSIDSYGNITTKKVDEYYSTSDNSFLQIIRFLTFPLWFIFHFVYVLIQSKVYLKIVWPTQAINAYKIASKHIPQYNISTKEDMIYKKELDQANKRREAVTRKNSVLGQEAIEQILSKYPVPINRLYINNTNFICVEKSYHFNAHKEKRFLRFVLSKKPDSTIEYSTLLETETATYKIYSEESQNNTCDWEKLGISKKAMNDISRLISNL